MIIISLLVRKEHTTKILPIFFEAKMGNGKEFRIICKELRQSIINWAEKYGINDLNITKSHANN